MRLIGYLLLLALIGYGLWPYYDLYRLDQALAKPDSGELAQMVDLTAIRTHYKKRVNAGIKGVLPADDSNSVVSWIRQNMERLGDSALEQAITLDWAQETLSDAVTRATGQSPPYLIAGIDFAFFESFNSFLVRIGELGLGETHVRLSLVDGRWKITDIVP